MNYNVRKVTNQLLEDVDNGLLTYEQIAKACLSYMSEDDVKEMAEANELIYEDEDNDE